MKKLLSVLLLNCFAAELFCMGATQPLEKAHCQLWSKFVGNDGIVLDYVGELPNAKDVKDGYPNYLSWWTPIENGAKFTGLYLAAMCRRAEISKSGEDKKKAEKLFSGLMKCASCSDVSGFIARGFASDGRSHYPCGSEDQTIPWLYGMYVYYKSSIASESARAAIREKFMQVCDALEKNKWNCPCDGRFAGQTRGDLSGFRFFQVPCYLFCLRAASIISGDSKWEGKYRRALYEKPAKSPANSKITCLEICTLGHEQDEGWLKNINGNLLWIYVKNYAVLRELYDAETDKAARKKFREGLENGAAYTLSTLEKYADFDNSQNLEFKLSNWKKYFKWRPQDSQKSAEKLAFDQTKIREAWGRRNYERKLMTMPLSAASICAFSGNPKYSETIEKAVSHYDYSKLNLGEIFFAEVAWWNSPQNRPIATP